jgi:anti-sigma28 factor (negative regulator of flagellin synthesis)
MSDIAPVGRTSPAAYLNGTKNVRHANGSHRPLRGDDRVEFSRAAQLLGKLHDLPDIREDLVERVRGEIAAGTYETPEKIDAAIESLLTDLAE